MVLELQIPLESATMNELNIELNIVFLRAALR